MLKTMIMRQLLTAKKPPPAKTAFAVLCQPGGEAARYKITAYFVEGARPILSSTRDKKKVARMFREKGVRITNNTPWRRGAERGLVTHSAMNDWVTWSRCGR